MRKSEQIKQEIACLNSEVKKISNLLENTRGMAATRYEQAKSNILQFSEEELQKIEDVRLEKTSRAKEAASTHYEQTKSNLLQFSEEEFRKIEGARLEKITHAKEEFNKKLGDIQGVIDAKNDLTFSGWSFPNWRSFDIEKERPSFKLTRLGSFVAQGENGILGMPAMLPILGGKNVLIKAGGTGRQKARTILRNISLRLLASLPPGKLRLTFIDPVELGSSAAGFIGALPDFLTGGMAWHEEQDIQNQLSLIETRIATIKTKYLGVRFNTIEQYNAHGGTIAEPYWLIMVSDCPVRFREAALEKLVSIAKNGPPAGVYLAVMVDEGQKRRDEHFISDIAQTANCIICPAGNASPYFDDSDFKHLEFQPDLPPPPDLIQRVAEQVNKTAALAQNVKVDWEPPPIESWWTMDSRDGFKIPIGTFGARQTQFFEINEKLLSSVLIIGKPGSGKSRLLHVLINSLTTRYSPSDLTLYLLDCKQVEFKGYATHKLPHAQVVAIESEREFGLSVLRRLNKELDFRKTEFSSVGENSLSSYRNKTGKPMPRIVLIIDEFQELLADDPLGRDASLILDRLVRLGRALGINIVLASQSLAGSTTALHASTRNQIPIRIVLQCSESDSTLVLSQDNDEARLLERSGEAIYNSTNGRREGNNRFQVNWLSDEALESLLIQINKLAAQKGMEAGRGQVIFAGDSLADIGQNNRFAEILSKDVVLKSKAGVFSWLGEPIEMKDPTAAIFKRQSRSNLVVLGQNEYEQSCVSMLMTSLVSITIQQPKEAARFIILNLSDPSAEWSQMPNIWAESVSHPTDLVTKNQFAEKLNELVVLIEKRAIEAVPTNHESVYLFVIGLHRERNLRRGDSLAKFSKTDPTKPLSGADSLSKICREGPACGVHCLVWCDTYSNFDRVFQRGDIDEFSLRVGLQMSESDSRSFIDSDAANKIGRQRAIFFDDEQHGRLEKFRPYSLPDMIWLKEVAKQLTK